MNAYEVQNLPEFLGRKDLGRIRLRLRPMLRSSGRISPPQQSAARGHAVSNNPLRFSAWPGSDCGVRAPYPAEIPLSWEEVQHGIAHGLLGPGDGEEDDGQGFVRGAA